MNNKLTPKQEAFAVNLFKGMSQREAYIAAGYSDKGKPKSLDEMACVVANSIKIISRLEELQSQASSVAVMEVQEKREFYAEVKRNPAEDTITRLRATDYDSKLAKHYDIPINYNDNRTINFIVKDNNELEGVKELLAGKKPEIPQHIEGDSDQ